MVVKPLMIINTYSRIIPLLYKTAAIKQHCRLDVKNIKKDKKNVNILHLCIKKKQKVSV